MGEHLRPEELTPREHEVLALLREELSNDAIAERLGISVAGVKYHVSEILGKLGLENRTDAARWAEEPSRPRAWSGALAPLALLRRVRPGWLSGVAGAGVAAAVVAALTVLIWALASSGGGSGSNISASVIDELQPGTTLHTVQVHFSRHGPADERLKLSESYQPETLRTEIWMTFGLDGTVDSMRSETTTVDGDVLQTLRTENGYLVYEEKDIEQRRSPLGDASLTDVKAELSSAQDLARAELASRPDAPTATVRGYDAVVIEDRRPYPTEGVHDVAPGNYVSVYVFDLQPVEEVKRQYLLPNALWGIRDEIVAVDPQGNETVIESWDYLTVEVLH